MGCGTGFGVSAIKCACWRVFFFQAEDGIRDTSVTGVQTCALPIYNNRRDQRLFSDGNSIRHGVRARFDPRRERVKIRALFVVARPSRLWGRWASCLAREDRKSVV